MKPCFFHDWSNWEQYVHKYQEIMTGILVQTELRGRVFECSALRQRRHCLTCGYSQDRKVREA